MAPVLGGDGDAQSGAGTAEDWSRTQREGSQLLPHQPLPPAQREVPGDVPGVASPVSPSMDTSALGSGAGLEGLERFVAGPQGSSRGCMAVVLFSASPAGHRDPTELVLWAGRSGFTPDGYLWVLHLLFTTPLPWSHLAPRASSGHIPTVSSLHAKSSSQLRTGSCPSLSRLPHLPSHLPTGSRVSQLPCPAPHTPAPLLTLSEQQRSPEVTQTHAGAERAPKTPMVPHGVTTPGLPTALWPRLARPPSPLGPALGRGCSCSS